MANFKRDDHGLIVACNKVISGNLLNQKDFDILVKYATCELSLLDRLKGMADLKKLACDMLRKEEAKGFEDCEDVFFHY